MAAPQGEPAPVEEGMHPAGWELAAAESGILAVLDILVVLGNPVLLGILEFYHQPFCRSSYASYSFFILVQRILSV